MDDECTCFNFLGWMMNVFANVNENKELIIYMCVCVCVCVCYQWRIPCLGGHENLVAYGMVPQYWLCVTSM